MQIKVNGVVDNTWGYTPNANGSSGSSQKTLTLSCTPGTTCSLTVEASIYDTDNAFSEWRSETLSYSAPPLPPAEDAPTVSLSPHPQDFLDLMCATCTNGAMTYTTPAYTSFDIARSVTLTYSSARAYPMGFVQIDAGLNVGNNPAGLSIQLVRNSQTVPLSNGADKAEYQWSGSIGTSRLAAQFDARTLGGANAYSYSVIADAWWSNGNHHPAAAQSARVLIIDEQNSPFGAGWSIAGLQRLVLNGVNADSIVLIDGSGTASFFEGCGFRCWTPPRGDYSALSFDGTYYWRKFADSTMERFSSTGLLLAIRNRFNDSTMYGYDASNRLTSITDPAGKVTTLAYSGDGSCTLGSAAGKLCRITTPGGRTTQVRVNASGDLDRIDDPDNVTALSMTYTNHLLTQWTNRSNATTNLTYDGFNQVKTIQAASVTTDQGVIRPTTSIVSLDSATLAPIGSGYGLRQRVLPENAAVTATAPKGTVTKTLSHRSGMPLQVDVRDPSGKHYLTTYTYDDSTRLSQLVNPSGGATVYQWEQSRLKSVSDLAAGTGTVYKYSTHYAQLDTMWVNGKFVQHNIYLASPNAYKVPDTVEVNNPGVVANNKTRYTYDAHGRVLTAVDPEQHQTSMVYESAGTFQNQSSLTVNGHTTSYTHDSFGRVYQVTDPTSRTLTMLYDPLNRDTSVAGPLGKRVRKTYNDGAGTYEVYDAAGQKYTTYVNPLGWVTQKMDPRTLSEYFTYDKHGNVVTYQPRRGSTYQVTFKYDTLDRLKERTANSQTTTFAYDTANKWIAVSNAEATDTVFTDPDERTTSAHSWRNGIRYEVNTGYSPDGTQGQKSVRGYNGSTQPYFGYTMSFGSDTLLRPVTIQDPVPKSTSFTYNKDNLPYVTTLPTGTTSTQHLQFTNSYNSAHALQQVSFNQALDYSLGRIYGYDALERQTTRDKGTSGDTYRRTVQYDDFGRLTGYTDTHIWEEEIWTCPGLREDDCYWDYMWHDDPIRSDSYSYDDAGNRTDRGAAAATSGNRISSFDGFSLTYDDDKQHHEQVEIRRDEPGIHLERARAIDTSGRQWCNDDLRI
jgi:YD repeat-containing protein